MSLLAHELGMIWSLNKSSGPRRCLVPLNHFEIGFSSALVSFLCLQFRLSENSLELYFFGIFVLDRAQTMF